MSKERRKEDAKGREGAEEANDAKCKVRVRYENGFAGRMRRKEPASAGVCVSIFVEKDPDREEESAKGKRKKRTRKQR